MRKNKFKVREDFVVIILMWKFLCIWRSLSLDGVIKRFRVD